MIPCDRCLEDVKREFELNCVKHVDVGLSDAELTEELDESNFIDGYHLDVDKLLFHESFVELADESTLQGRLQGIMQCMRSEFKYGVL